jgi:hypothetical protein
MITTKRPPRKSRPAPRPDAFAYTIHDACLLTGIGRTKLYQLINAQHLQVSRAAGRVLVVGDSLRAMFSASRV